MGNIEKNWFLPYLVRQDLTGVREETGRARGNRRTWKRKTRDKGC